MEGGLLGALATEVDAATLLVGVAGAVSIGVVLAQRAVFWLQCVLIERQASREAMEWERERT